MYQYMRNFLIFKITIFWTNKWPRIQILIQIRLRTSHSRKLLYENVIILTIICKGSKAFKQSATRWLELPAFRFRESIFMYSTSMPRRCSNRAPSNPPLQQTGCLKDITALGFSGFGWGQRYLTCGAEVFNVSILTTWCFLAHPHPSINLPSLFRSRPGHHAV